jgi:hypothetical protein
MKKTLLTLSAIAMLAVGANAALIVSEPFSYTDQPLVGASASWSAFSGADDTITISGNKVAVGSGAEDVEMDFGTTISSGTAYLGIDINVSDASASDYVLGFRASGSLVARLFLDDVSGGYVIGVNNGGTGGGSAGAFGSTVLSLNTTYRIVLSFDRDEVVKAWINPTASSEASPEVSYTNTNTAVQNPDAFFFRQGGAWDNGEAAWTADNLKVSTAFVDSIPEPTTLAAVIGGLGLMGILRRRRA